MLPAFDLRTARFDRVGDDRPHIDDPAFEFKLAALNTRDVEHVVRQPPEVLRLPRDDVEGTDRSLIGGNSLLKHRRRCNNCT